MIVLRLFGGISIEGGLPALTGRAAQRRPVGLLVLLAVAHPRALTRDKAIAYLWPENDARHARNLLSQAVHALRQALGAEAILSTADELRLNPERVTSDIRLFEEALSVGDRERAVELYAGPFIDGFFLGDSAEFEHWTDSERDRLLGAYLQALQELGEEASTRNDPVGAVAWLRRLVAEEPYNSRVTLRLMEALEAAGDRAGAIRQAATHAALMRQDLDAEPTPEVVELAERMRTEPARAMELAVAEEADPPTLVHDGTMGEAADQPDSKAPPPMNRRRTGWVVAAAAALLVLTMAGYMGMRMAGIGPAATLISKGTVEANGHVLITDFVSPADELLGRTAAELLRTSFSMSAILHVPSEAAIGSALQRMGREPGELRPGDARELATREGYVLVTAGEIAHVGAGYVLTARLIEAESGEVLGRFRATAAGHDDFVNAVDRISAGMRARIGESAQSIRRSTPLAQVTTPSLEALKAYTQAVRLRMMESRWDEAIPWFERAIELDSTFGAAHQGLGITLFGLGRDPERAESLFNAAYRHRDRMTPLERVMADEQAVFLRARMQPDGAGFVPDLLRLHEEFLQLHGPHPASLHNLGFYYWFTGRVEDAIGTLERRLGIEYSTLSQVWLINSRIWSGDLEGAERDLEVLRDRTGDVLDWYLGRADMALARGDFSGAHDILEEAAARHADQQWALAFTLEQRAIIDAALGRLDHAERHMRERIAQAEAGAASVEVLLTTVGLATMLTMANPTEAPRAKRLLDDAVRQHPPPESGDGFVYWWLTTVHALHGDTHRAREFLDAALRIEPGFTNAWYGALPRASFSAAEGRYRDAIEIAGAARRMKPAHPDRQLLPVLAAAYVEAGMPDSAIAAYEHLVTDPDLQRRDLWRVYWAAALPRAHRELGRLYEERGDTALAAEHLARFIELWREADPALQPQVRDAARRLAALRRD